MESAAGGMMGPTTNIVSVGILLKYSKMHTLLPALNKAHHSLLCE